MPIDRRQFIKLMGSSGAALYTLGMLGGCESLLEQIRNRPTRKNISTLANNDPIVEAYRAAVSAMKALPNSDRRNWTRQAEIHNDFCPHGNWYFLPWHRAYLYYFETIIRQLSGYKDFALPYWNWTCQPKMPAHFFGAGNSLFNATRTKGATDSVPDSYTGEDILADILDISDFENFGSFESTALRNGSGGGFGELEGTPHNLVHGWIGGDMGGYMSPLDPIFWCHHNMIERCWWEWNISRGNPNPNSNNWYELSLGGMFCDKEGDLINNLTVGTTALMPLLSYQFDDQLVPCSNIIKGFSPIPLNKSTAELREFLEKGGSFRIKALDQIKAESLERIVVHGQQENTIKLPNAVRKLLMAETLTNRRYILKVNNASIKEMRDVFVRLFINPPKGHALRDKDNLYYAGSFAFFEDGQHAQHAGGNTYHIDITNTIKRLKEKSLLKDGEDLSISLVAVSILDGKSIPRGRVELSDLEILLSQGKPEQ